MEAGTLSLPDGVAASVAIAVAWLIRELIAMLMRKQQPAEAVAQLVEAIQGLREGFAVGQAGIKHAIETANQQQLNKLDVVISESRNVSKSVSAQEPYLVRIEERLKPVGRVV